MESYERTTISSVKTVHIEKGWKQDEFTAEFHSSSLSPVVLLEDDPRKKLRLCWFKEVQNGCTFRKFVLRVAIKGSWMCRGNCKTTFRRSENGSEVYSSGNGGLVDILLLETCSPWVFVEIDFLFVLNEVEIISIPIVKEEELAKPMSCDDVCDKFLNSEGPCIFVLKVEQKEIMVHGCLLAMHSEVFKRMIEQDGFREGRERVVEITDSEYDSVMAMVRFMHGFSDAARDHPEGVLALADKYAVEPLKEFAVAKLKERVDRSTIAHIASVATVHAAPTLFEECKEYVAANFRELSATAEWKNLRDTNPELLLKLVCNSGDD